MNDRSAVLKRASKRLALLSVDLSSLTATRLPSYGRLPSGLALDVQFRNGTVSIEEISPEEEGAGPNMLVFLFQAGMRLLLRDSPDPELPAGTQVAEIVADFQCTYQISGKEDLDADGVDLFAQLNVPYNAWPYWRELCQNTGQRMLLPPVRIPMLRVNVDGSTIQATDQ